jgi:dihydroneopterin aldolase
MMTREAVIEAIKVQTDEFRANVRAAVEKELKKPNSRLVKEIAEGAASAVMNAANSPWRINVSFDRKD